MGNHSKLGLSRPWSNGVSNMSVRVVSTRSLSSIIQKRLFSSIQKCVILLPGERLKYQKYFILIPNGVFHSNYSVVAKIDKTQPFAYYEILGIKRDAKQSEVKQAYFKLAKVYHPDVNQEDNARDTFDKITEAYTTLIDLTQRYFYDQHGVACEELRKRGSNSTIFDWVPKYSIYENQTRADGESTAVEDWFKAQGHQGFDDKRISLRQMMKNAYVEFRYGISYYDFPWEWRNFVLGLVGWVVVLSAILTSLNYAYSKVSYRKPVPLYLKWENDDIYDILWYAGARRNKSDKSNRSGLRFPTNSQGIAPQSEMARAGMHHMPKRAKQTSEYSHTIYSNTRSRAKKKNMKDFKQRKEEMERKKIATKLTSKSDDTDKKKRKKISDGFSV